MKTIGLVMIVKNEGRSLEKCLSRIRQLVDEIYITDTGSTDNTLEIAEKYQAHVSHFVWKNDFSAARNFALSQSSCDWNLVLDADEYLVSGKRKDLQRFIEKGGFVGAIQRHDSYKEESGELSRSIAYITRLLPRDTWFEGRIHEQVVSPLPIAPLPLVFDHDGYLQEGKGERNLEILLDELREEPEDPYILYQAARTLWLMKDYARADGYFENFYRCVPDSGTGYRTSGVISYIYNLMVLKKYETGFEIIENEAERLTSYADSYMRCLEIGEVPEHEGVYGNGSFKAAYNLGVWYEVNGDVKKALNYYRKAQSKGYQLAKERIKKLM